MPNKGRYQSTKAPNFKGSLPNGNKAFAWYLFAAVILILDQISKYYFVSILDLYESIPVLEPVFSFTLAHNHGAAFSFLADQAGWQKWFFSGLALLVSVFLLWYLRKVPRCATLLSLAMSMILGGAVGNLIDRVQYGYVIDFLHVHYYDVWHYPVFNIADCGIVLGVMLMIFDMLFLESKRSA